MRSHRSHCRWAPTANSFTELTSEPPAPTPPARPANPRPLGAGLSSAASERALSRGAGSHRTPLPRATRRGPGTPRILRPPIPPPRRGGDGHAAPGGKAPRSSGKQLLGLSSGGAESPAELRPGHRPARPHCLRSCSCTRAASARLGV